MGPVPAWSPSETPPGGASAEDRVAETPTECQLLFNPKTSLANTVLWYAVLVISEFSDREAVRRTIVAATKSSRLRHEIFDVVTSPGRESKLSMVQ